MECRMCGSNKLNLFLDLDFIQLVDNFLTSIDLQKPETFYPLNVCLCNDCGLSQLGYLVPADKLFNENYAYESGVTKTRKENYSQLASRIVKQYGLTRDSLVVDIGSNVGLLLDCFSKFSIKTIGVDASENIVEQARKNGIETIHGFFNESIVNEIIFKYGKADVITATNVFAHIQDYESFMKSLLKLLKNNGIFVFQAPHFLELIKNFEYDTIYHEHVSYLSLKPLKKLFEKFNMEIFDVQKTEIDGGSLTCYVSRKNFYCMHNIEEILREENSNQIYCLDRLKTFSNAVKIHKDNLRKLLVDLKSQGKSIVGIGAPAKGITLLNYCNIDTSLLDFITEKSPLKIGKYTPGTHIPIYSDDKLMTECPDYALILSWNFANEIMKNLDGYHKKGGKFIMPIPHPKIVE